MERLPVLAQTKETELVQDKCGVVAYFSPEPRSIIPKALTAAYGVQHRGQGGFGLGFISEEGNFISYRRFGLLSDTFRQPLKFEEGDTPFSLGDRTNAVIVHTRYGTYGDNEIGNLQPCTAKASSGEKIAVIHNGEFVAIDEMKNSVSKGFKEGDSDTYVYTHLLAETNGENWDEKVVKSLTHFKGAYFLAILAGGNLYVARDPDGIRPGVLGRHGDSWIAASETFGLYKLDAEILREVKRGEILRIDKNGIKVLREGLNGPGNFCVFEKAYFARPESLLPTFERDDDSDYPERWISNALFRERCGQMLAQETPLPQLDFIVGVPDSGIAFAMGYANSLSKPYRPVIIRDHYDENGAFRLFQGEEIDAISEKVLGKLKLVPDRRIWDGAIVGFGDDSIVRGNESPKITLEAFELGAKEVHWLVGYPQVRYGCHLGVSMRTENELIAARNNGDLVKIAQEIGATSVNYISNSGFIKAGILSGKIKTPEDLREIFLVNGGCGGCITGLYPVDKFGNRYKSPEKEFARV